MFNFSFNNYNSADYGIKIIETSPITLTRRAINTIEVPGRPPLHSEGEYLGHTKDIFCRLDNVDRRNLAWLNGFGELRLSWERGYFYKAKVVEQVDFTALVSNKRTFNATFEVEPFAYVDNVQKVIIDRNTTITNNYTAHSQPKMKIYGTGTITVSVNRRQFTITNVVDWVEVDSSLLVVNKGAENFSNKFTGDFPILDVGANNIVLTNVTRIEIEPKWRCL